jgi:hypothetical protein
VWVVLMIGLQEIENNTKISDDIINDKEMKNQSNFGNKVGRLHLSKKAAATNGLHVKSCN